MCMASRSKYVANLTSDQEPYPWRSSVPRSVCSFQEISLPTLRTSNGPMRKVAMTAAYMARDSPRTYAAHQPKLPRPVLKSRCRASLRSDDQASRFSLRLQSDDSCGRCQVWGRNVHLQPAAPPGQVPRYQDQSRYIRNPAFWIDDPSLRI